jgi:mono/diheme cytochrome c family protein
MSRLAKILGLCLVAVTVTAVTAACGTQTIGVPKADTGLHNGAVLFNQRCSGCHTLSFADANGSAPNIRVAQANNGPNFNQRCERPIDRVLYAIENGGFSGAYMPQNVVVGQDAIDVAKFVATYAGRQAPREVGIKPCEQLPLGTLPAGSASVGSPTATTAASVTRKGKAGTAVASVAHAQSGGKRSRSAKHTARS